jgi:hypothetical protein
LVVDLILGSLWFTPREKNVRATMEFKVPKRHRPTLFTDMVQQILRWEKQKRCSGRKRQRPMQRDIVMNGGFFFIIKTALVGHELKNSTHSLFGA